MEPQIGQRWRWGTVIIEVSEIAQDKSWYKGMVVQNSGSGVKPGDMFGSTLPGWHNGTAFTDLWSYLPGQDKP